jgi:hypothetical protein
VLEAASQITDGARKFRVDGVFHAARGGGVVRLIEDEHAARGKVTEVVTQAADVRLVDEKAMRDQEPRMRGPRVHAVATLTPYTRDVIAIENLEGQPKASLHLLAPLKEHGGWRGNDDLSNFSAEQQLARYETSFDRLAKTDIVGDKKVYTRQQQSLAKRLQLVSIEADPCSEGGLKKTRVGRRYRIRSGSITRRDLHTRRRSRFSHLFAQPVG